MFTAVQETFNDSMRGVLISNAIIAYFSGSALQYLWGLIHSIQLTVFTSLFNVEFPENAKMVLSLMWELIIFDFFHIEQLVSEIEFRETEAFQTTYDQDGEPESKFADAGYETSNFFELVAPVYFLLILSLLLVSLKLTIQSITQKCKHSCLKSICIGSVNFSAIFLRFGLEACLDIGLSAIIAIFQADEETFEDGVDIAQFAFAIANLLCLLLLPLLLTWLGCRYLR